MRKCKLEASHKSGNERCIRVLVRRVFVATYSFSRSATDRIC